MFSSSWGEGQVMFTGRFTCQRCRFAASSRVASCSWVRGRSKSMVTTSAPQVEAHVFAAPEVVGQPGDDVLPGVLLHQVKPPVPVDYPGDRRPRLQGVVAGMDDLPVPAVDLQHLDLSLSACRLQTPGVVGLAPPSG